MCGSQAKSCLVGSRGLAWRSHAPSWRVLEVTKMNFWVLWLHTEPEARWSLRHQEGKRHPPARLMLVASSLGTGWLRCVYRFLPLVGQEGGAGTETKWAREGPCTGQATWGWHFEVWICSHRLEVSGCWKALLCSGHLGDWLCLNSSSATSSSGHDMASLSLSFFPCHMTVTRLHATKNRWNHMA